MREATKKKRRSTAELQEAAKLLKGQLQPRHTTKQGLMGMCQEIKSLFKIWAIKSCVGDAM